MSDGTDAVKIIKRTHNQQEARILVSYLVSHGVDAVLLDGAINSVLPIVAGGVRVAVPDEQEPKAKYLLDDIESRNRNDEGSAHEITDL